MVVGLCQRRGVKTSEAQRLLENLCASRSIASRRSLLVSPDRFSSCLSSANRCGLTQKVSRAHLKCAFWRVQACFRFLFDCAEQDYSTSFFAISLCFRITGAGSKFTNSPSSMITFPFMTEKLTFCGVQKVSAARGSCRQPAYSSRSRS